MILQPLVMPKEIVVKDGRAAGVACNHMWLVDFDRSGRRRPEAYPDKTFVEEADQVIAAIGQKLPLEQLTDGVDLKQNAWRFVDANPVTGQTSAPWIFAGGDAVEGPSSVVDAVGAGERAAVGIDQYLTGEEHAFWRTPCPLDTEFDPDAEPVEAPRAHAKLIAVEKRKGRSY